MSNSFFAGLEAFMEDNPVEATATVTVQPEEHIEEVSEADDAATEQGELNTEIQEINDKTEMYLAEFDRCDQMIAHVKKYGVDRTFLSLCNQGNVLAEKIHVKLPACESFDSVGSSTSAISVAALEGLKETAKKIYDFIVNVCLRMKDWIVRFAKMYDLRLSSLEKRAKALQSLAKTNKQKRELSAEDKEKLKDVEVFKLDDLENVNSKAFTTVMAKISAAKSVDEANKITIDEFKMPKKVSLSALSESNSATVQSYAETALAMVDGAKDLLTKQLPQLRKAVEKLKSDAGSKTIEADVAKLELAKNKTAIRLANATIGRFLKVGNAAVASGSVVQSKLFQKPGAEGTKESK